MNKLAIAYGEALPTWADVVICSHRTLSLIPNAKTANPNVTYLIYYDALAEFSDDESFYVKSNGERITHKEWGWELRDISNPTCRAASVDIILQMAEHCDGIFLDDCMSYLPDGYFDKPISEYYNLLFYPNMVAFINEIKAAIGDKKLIINSGTSHLVTYSNADGQMYEMWGCLSWDSTPRSGITDILQCLQKQSSGKEYYAVSNCAEGVDLFEYCQALFLIADDGTGHFCYAKSYRAPEDWEAPVLGEPTGMFKKDGQTLIREFEHGIVTVDLDNQTGAIEYFEISLEQKISYLETKVLKAHNWVESLSTI